MADNDNANVVVVGESEVNDKNDLEIKKNENKTNR